MFFIPVTISLSEKKKKKKEKKVRLHLRYIYAYTDEIGMPKTKKIKTFQSKTPNCIPLHQNCVKLQYFIILSSIGILFHDDSTF